MLLLVICIRKCVSLWNRRSSAWRIIWSICQGTKYSRCLQNAHWLFNLYSYIYIPIIVLFALLPYNTCSQRLNCLTFLWLCRVAAEWNRAWYSWLSTKAFGVKTQLNTVCMFTPLVSRIIKRKQKKASFLKLHMACNLALMPVCFMSYVGWKITSRKLKMSRSSASCLKKQAIYLQFLNLT